MKIFLNNFFDIIYFDDIFYLSHKFTNAMIINYLLIIDFNMTNHSL
jgi:hypothetical protein